MQIIEVKQNLVESQRSSIKTQLLNVGIQVLVKVKRGQTDLVGYVDTFTGDNPIRVKIRLLDTLDVLQTEKLLVGKQFKFLVKQSRFVLNAGI